jgi:ubiquinone/menaquinone biosynthesis C-methylase UbiE
MDSSMHTSELRNSLKPALPGDDATQASERYIFERFRSPENEGIVGDEVDDEDFILRCFLSNLGPLAGKVVLDAGCGKGKYTRALARMGARLVVGLDPTPGYLGHGLRAGTPDGRVGYLCGTISRIPIPDRSVDAVICSEVIEHIPDPSLVFAEMARVLKPGGKVLVLDKQKRALHPRYLVPVSLWKRWRERTGHWMYPASSPFREIWYGPEELEGIMSRHFSMDETEFLHAPGRSAILFRRLPRRTWLYCCWKGTKSA